MDLNSTPTRTALRALAAALAAGVALSAWPALAQLSPLRREEPIPLRGAIEERSVSGSALDRPSLTERRSPLENLPGAPPVPQYRPVSAGATEDAEQDDPPAGASLFEETDTQADIFENPVERRAAARPSSARQRAEEADGRRTPSEPETRRVTAAEAATVASEDAEEPTGSVRIGAVEPLDPDIVGAADTADARTDAIEGSDLDPEDDPYAPLGLRVGTFNVNATFDQSIGYSSNPDFSADGRGATISESGLRLAAASDWSRHQMRIDAFGTYRKSLSGEEVDDQEAGISAALDLDLADFYGASATLGYSLRPESASSPIDFTGVLDRPVRQMLNGSASVFKDEGKLRLAATGEIERSWYGDADLLGGGTLTQEDRNYTLATATLRAGYEVSPAFVPFVEGEIGRRFYELDVDANGYDRSSNRLGARAGAEIDLGEKITGEFAAGWLRETIDDDRLAAISGLTADASLAWSPQRGTIVRLLGSTTVEGTTTAAESGSILYSGTLAVDHELRANLTATASIGGYFRDYSGSTGEDRGFIAESSLTWWLNRHVALTGRARYEALTSTLPGRDADVASVFAGFRLQR